MARRATLVERIAATIEQEERELADFFVFPKWFPTYQREFYRRLCAGILNDLRAALSVKPAAQKINPKSIRVDGGERKRLAVYKNQKPTYAHLSGDPLKTLRVFIDRIKSEENPIIPGVFASHHISLAHELSYLEYVASLEPKEARKEFKKPDAWINWRRIVGANASVKKRRSDRDARKQVLDGMWLKVRAYIQEMYIEDYHGYAEQKDWETLRGKFITLTDKEAQEFIKRFKRERRVSRSR